MLGGIGEWLVLAAVVVIVLGFRKLPSLGKSLAASVHSFRRGLRAEVPPPREVNEVKPPTDS